MKIKVLIITAHVLPTSAQGIRYKNLVKYLLPYFNIVHLTLDSKCFSFNGCRNIDITILPKKLIKGIHYISKKIFFPDQYLSTLFLYKKSISKLLRYENFDSVIICMTPFSFLRLGKFINKLNPNITIIGDMSDPFSANANLYNNPPKKKRAQQFEKKYLPYFDALIVLNDSIKQYYKQYNIKKDIFVIEQGVNDIFTSKVPLLPLKNKLRLIYTGRFYKSFRDPANLFDVLSKEQDKYNLYIYGATDIPKYKFIIANERITQDKLIQALSEAHVLALIDNAYGIQVPGKTIECLTFNRPVLFIYENKNSPTLKYVKESTCVYLAKNNKTDIQLALEQIWDEYGRYEKIFNPSPYLWKNLAIQFKAVIEQLNNT